MGDQFEDEDSAVQDFLAILEEHRKNCENEGKYVEAEIARNRLAELQLHEENRRREAMRSRQIAERLGVEEAHMLEFQQFNQIWDSKMKDYEEHSASLIANLKVSLMRLIRWKVTTYFLLSIIDAINQSSILFTSSDRVLRDMSQLSRFIK